MLRRRLFSTSLRTAALSRLPTRGQLAERLRRAETYVNQSTGYDEISVLKQSVALKDAAFSGAKARQREAKEAHGRTILDRSNLQRELNGLLQRKHSWSPEDLARFTELYQREHSLERAECDAREAATAAEDAVDQAQNELMTSIRERYNGEQMYSDKIRAVSTIGTITLILINLLSFIVVHSIVEPRRRRKMIESLDRSIAESQNKFDAKLSVLKEDLLAATAVDAPGPQQPAPAAPPDHHLLHAERRRPWLHWWDNATVVNASAGTLIALLVAKLAKVFLLL